MTKKLLILALVSVIFGILFSSYALAAGTPIASIERVRLNDKIVVPSRTNFADKNNSYDVLVEFTALQNLVNARVEAILKDTISGAVISDVTPAFNLAANSALSKLLRLDLPLQLRNSNSFELTIRIIDAQGKPVQNIYGIRTDISSSSSSSSSFDVSINRATINGNVISESRTNIINEANAFAVVVDFTSLGTLENAHAEAILRGRQSSNTISDSTTTFNLGANQNSASSLRLVLDNRLDREKEFDLTIKIIDSKGRSKEKTYTLRTEERSFGGQLLDVSIDRVRANGKVIASSSTNFIEDNNDFDILVDFTALERLKDAHAEATLKDLTSGNVVADATSNFNLTKDSSASKLLRLELLDKLKKSGSFELTVKIADAEGNSVQKLYGLRMRDGSVSGGRALDISINSAEVEDKVIAEDENNFVIIGTNKKKLDLSVRLTALENIKNARVDAVLTFENGESVADATSTFDINKNQNLVKELELPLIGAFEQNSFRLKIRIANADGDAEEKSYGLKLSTQKFPFVVSSISLSPEDNVEAGKNLIARLSFKNSGVVPIDGVNAKISIPELGISSTKLISQIKNANRMHEIREDFILKILDDVPTGTYTLRSEIASQFGSESDVKEVPVFILGKGGQINNPVNDRLVINVAIAKQDIYNDGSEAIYPIILTNEGPEANTYTLLLDGANWADLKLKESNVFVINPKESRTISIYASAKENAKGEQAFLATIKTDDKVLKQIPLKGNVIAVKIPLTENLKSILELISLGVVVLLLAMGSFFGIKRVIGREEGKASGKMPEPETDTYY